MKHSVQDLRFRQPLRVVIYLLILLFFCLFTFDVVAQNGASCYKPITGNRVSVSTIQNNTTCVNCGVIQDEENIIDADRNNFADYNSVGLVGNSGVAVTDSLDTYPAGWHAGYVVSIGNTLLTASVISNISIQTYNNGLLRENKTSATGLQVRALSDNTGRLYINFPTTLSFDEVRFIITSAVSAINTLEIYYATAFDPQCGLSDNNTICLDQIAGPSTHVSHNGGLTNALVTLANDEQITDGDRNSFATLTLPAGVNLLSEPPYVSVLEEELVHPAGHRAGFIIGYPTNLLSADVLNTMSLRTYLHGQLQETATFGNGTGLLAVSALNTELADRKEISFVTTLPFNEVQLVVGQTATVNVGTVNIYYAFESGPSCTNFEQPIVAGQPAPDNGTLNGARTGTFGVVCINQFLTDAGNVANANLGDFATFEPAVLSVGCGAQISVQNNGTDYPGGTFAGFRIGMDGGLVDLGLLDAITINVYQGGGLNPVASSTGAGLLDLGVLSDDDSITTIGFRPGVPFDEIQIVFNSGLISASLDGSYRIYNAFIVRDTDNDGIPDGADVCPGASDVLDSDGDGTPDPCDPCTALNSKSAYADTDGDGVQDACDADTDDDGIADAVEDRNGDGQPANDDADLDGIQNYLDLDSDDDGIPDLFESGITSANITVLDANHNAVIDASAGRGGNGMANTVETSDATGAGNNYTLADTDGDGIPDFVDLDTDNDGINDNDESGNPALTDVNGDGMVDGPDDDNDGIQNTADGNLVRGANNIPDPVDTDGDGVRDFRDLDSDNDLKGDLVEGGETGYNDIDQNGVADGSDIDGDGIVDDLDGDDDNFGDRDTPALADTDNDNIPDYRDPDSDNDGTNDIVDVGLGGNDLDGDGMVDDPSDPDGDGIPNNNGSDLDPDDFGGIGSSTLLNVQLLLQGALNNNGTDTLMRDDLRQMGLIPVMQPYNGSTNARFTQYNGGGEEMTTTAILNAQAGTPNAIVDWVLLEFRDPGNPATIERTMSALLQRDGDVVNTDGNRLGIILPVGNYRLSVKHRNHLGAMTAATSVASGTPATADFKHGTTATSGTNATTMIAPGYYALYGGDVNSNGNVFYTAPSNDRDALLLLLSGSQFNYLSTYNNGDVNMDGETYYTAPDNDRDWLLLNPLDGNEFGFVQEQLP